MEWKYKYYLESNICFKNELSQKFISNHVRDKQRGVDVKHKLSWLAVIWTVENKIKACVIYFGMSAWDLNLNYILLSVGVCVCVWVQHQKCYWVTRRNISVKWSPIFFQHMLRLFSQVVNKQLPSMYKGGTLKFCEPYMG